MKLKFLLIFALFIAGAQALLAAPVITAINPSSGPVGTLVTVMGTGLNDPTAFTIGSTPAVIVSNTGTKLVAMVMAATTGGSVNIQTSAGTASFGSFTTTVFAPPGKQQGSKVTINDSFESPIVDPSQRDRMVAVSADGTTAIIGGYSGKIYKRNGDL